MRELNFENQGTNTYLVYEIKETDIVDTMSLGMLTNNKINGIAQTVFTQMDNKQYIKFNVSAKVSVAQFFTGVVNKKRLLGVFKGITDALLAAEDYMLDTANMLLDIDYIYTDVSSCETVVVCIPVTDEDVLGHDLKTFFRNILFSTQFDQTENCDHVAKLINYLNSTQSFAVAEFNELVASMLRGESVKTEPVQNVQKPIAQSSQKVEGMAEKVQQSNEEVVTQESPILQQPKVERPMQQPKVENSVPIQIPISADTAVKEEIQDAANGAEKQMTMFNLLRNFSKENVAIYKSQKEAQKAMPKAEKGKKDRKEKTKPNVETPTGFAIPGQQASASIPQPQPQVAPQPSAPAPQSPPASASQPTAQSPVSNLYAQQPTNNFTQVRANFGETTVLNGGGIGETTVLSNMTLEVQVPKVAYLIRVKNNEKILLNKPVYRIGKEKSYVDYFIGDNTAISRSHADIITKENSHYIRDNNSTNHTYVNGAMIPSNEEILIRDGAKIRLANEDFEFYM